MFTLRHMSNKFNLLSILIKIHFQHVCQWSSLHIPVPHHLNVLSATSITEVSLLLFVSGVLDLYSKHNGYNIKTGFQKYLIKNKWKPQYLQYIIYEFSYRSYYIIECVSLWVFQSSVRNIYWLYFGVSDLYDLKPNETLPRRR